MRVENTLEGDGTEIPVKLEFSSMDDFQPASIVQQVDPLKKLMETRQQLTELQTKVDLAAGLEDKIDELLKDADKISQISSQLEGGEKPASSEGGEE